MTTISIIGSTRDKSKQMTKTHFDNAVKLIEQLIIKANYSWDKVILKSGGAAWMDHIAVVLAIKHKCRLILCFPCKFIDNQYLDTGSSDWRINPGRLANKCHHSFSQAMGYNTLNEITLANPQISIFNGFHARNKCVAECDILIALTPHDTISNKGGTAHTYNLCKSYKMHIPLLRITN